VAFRGNISQYSGLKNNTWSELVWSKHQAELFLLFSWLTYSSVVKMEVKCSTKRRLIFARRHDFMYHSIELFLIGSVNLRFCIVWLWSIGIFLSLSTNYLQHDDVNFGNTDS
jgi:hypothetical protein